jgi:signal transduction histidine kinase/CHASE2 domain-containing sensor protein
MNADAKIAKLSGLSLARWIRLIGVLLGLVLFAAMSFPVATLSQKLNDLYFRLRPPLRDRSQVAMVLIDDASLARYGRWPWSRTRLAELVNAVSAQHPKVIGLDILLSEPQDESSDSALEAALRSTPNVVLAAKISGALDDKLWIDPLPRFVRAANGVGHVQAIVDSDGICRSIPAQEPTIDGARQAFSLKIAALMGAAPSFATRAPANIEEISLRPLIINYRQQFSPADSETPFSVLSAADLLSGKRAPQLAGKAVLIGFGSVELSDRLNTPVSTQLPMPGVEINANAVDTILSGRTISPVGLGLQLAITILAGIIFLWLVVRFPGVHGLLVLSALLATGYLGSYFLFAHWHLLFSYGPVLLAGILAAPLAQLENLIFVDREVSGRLRLLYQTIRPQAAPDSDRLHWKIAAIAELQTELSSLYSFQKTLFETMREGVAVYSEDGTLRFSNPAWKRFCALHHAAPETLAGLTPVTSAWPELAAVAQAGGTWIETELPLGEELWHFHAVPLPWTSFAESGAVLLIAEDITTRRERDQARSEALSFVTHELRTPLISIQGFSELLMRYPGSAASADAPGTIFRESNRLVAMINTYLEVLRLDAGARPLKLKQTDIRGMLEHVEKVVQPLAAAARIQVRTNLNVGAESLSCDETLISGALLNLVSNAIKYGAAGSEVCVSVCSQDEQVQFEVHNSGPAIAAADLKQIFDRFYRPARSESIPGWGLGLSFVRRICQQHGGSVRVASDEQAGTSFTITLPRGAREMSEVAP